MANKLTGRIVSIAPAQTLQARNGNEYQKRRLILDCTPYDRYTGERDKRDCIVPLDFFGKKCAFLDTFQPGQVASVSFTVNSHAYQRKDTGETDYIVSLDPYAIEALHVYQTASAAPAAPAPTTAQPQGEPVAQIFPDRNKPQQPFTPSQTYPQAQSANGTDLPF